jgi:hypothetical protein
MTSNSASTPRNDLQADHDCEVQTESPTPVLSASPGRDPALRSGVGILINTGALTFVIVTLWPGPWGVSGTFPSR